MVVGLDVVILVMELVEADEACFAALPSTGSASTPRPAASSRTARKPPSWESASAARITSATARAAPALTTSTRPAACWGGTELLVGRLVTELGSLWGNYSAINVKVAVVGCAGAITTLIVDKEGFKIAEVSRVEVHCPYVAGLVCPSSQQASAADNRLFVCECFINDRSVGGTRIAAVEGKRLRNKVASSSQSHHDGRTTRTFLHLPHRLASTVQRGEWTIALSRVGRFQGAAPGVAAVRRDIEVRPTIRGGRRNGCLRGGCDEENCQQCDRRKNTQEGEKPRLSVHRRRI